MDSGDPFSVYTWLCTSALLAYTMGLHSLPSTYLAMMCSCWLGSFTFLAPLLSAMDRIFGRRCFWMPFSRHEAGVCETCSYVGDPNAANKDIEDDGLS